MTGYKNIAVEQIVRENLDENPQELILSYAYPFKSINSQSIAKYIKLFLFLQWQGYTLQYLWHITLAVHQNNVNNISLTIIGLSIKDIQNAAD